MLPSWLDEDFLECHTLWIFCGDSCILNKLICTMGKGLQRWKRGFVDHLGQLLPTVSVQKGAEISEPVYTD